MTFERVATVAEVPVGTGKAVEVAGERVALFHTEEGWFAIEDSCSHVGAPLSGGTLSGTTVACPLHGSVFDLRTGEPQMPPATLRARCYEVRVDGDDVLLASSPRGT